MLPKSVTEHVSNDFGRGVKMLADDKPESALAAFQKSLEEAVGDKKADSLYNIAVCHVRLGNHDAAREALRQAVALDPSMVSDIAPDEDFAPLRSGGAFEEIVKRSATST